MSDVLDRLAELLEQRKSANPDSSYVAKLYAKGMDSILKKVGEEATETVIAAKGGNKDEIIYETADLWFHTLIMLAKAGLKPQDVLDELARREGLSGITEKESRVINVEVRIGNQLVKTKNPSVTGLPERSVTLKQFKLYDALGHVIERPSRVDGNRIIKRKVSSNKASKNK